MTYSQHRPTTMLVALTAGCMFAAATTLLVVSPAHSAVHDLANTTAIDLLDSYTQRDNPAAITIPSEGPASSYPSEVAVSGVSGTVTDVEVKLNGIQHDHPDDLDVMLVGPGGQRVILMSDAGGGLAPGFGLLIDDQASSAMPDDGQLLNGAYRPTNYGIDGEAFPAPAPSAAGAGSDMSVFDGTDPNGTWKLYVVDDSSGGSGSLQYGWKLSLRTSITSSLYPAPIAVSGLAGPVTDVDVTLHGLSHTFPEDLDVLVVGPSGQRALVMSDIGEDHDVTGIDVRLDDEAPVPLPAHAVLTGGSFQPLDNDNFGVWSDTDEFVGDPGSTANDYAALSVFDGTDPNGTWKLYVSGDWEGETGVIAGGWSLSIATADGSTPPPTSVPTTGSGASAPGSAPDRTHPRVGSSSPEPRAERVRPGRDVHATFSEAVRRVTLTNRSVKLVRRGSTAHLPATLTYDRATHTMIVDPSRRLRHDTTYRVIVTTGVKDHAGNHLDQKPSVAGNQNATWTFTTR